MIMDAGRKYFHDAWASMTEPVTNVVLNTGAGALLARTDPRGLAIGYVALEVINRIGFDAVIDWSEKLSEGTWKRWKTIGGLTSVVFAGLIAGWGMANFMNYETSLGALCVGAATVKAAKVAYILFLEPDIKDDPDIIKITKKNYQKEVLESDLPVIIDCYRGRCPPCKKLAPIFSKLNKEMGDKIKFVSLHTREEPDLAKELPIKGVPTLVFFKDGKVVDKMFGFKGEQPLLNKINETF